MIAKTDIATIAMKMETAFNAAKKTASGNPKQRRHHCWKAAILVLRAIDDETFDPLNPPTLKAEHDLS
jgi:hypothetical protein